MAIYTKCSRCRKKILKGTVCECSKERHKEYNKRVRFNSENKKYADFYNSVAWKRLSRYIKLKYNSLCLSCLVNHNEVVACEVVHHIDEVREDWEARLREDNLITLCHSCHNTLHANYIEKDKLELRNILQSYSRKYG